MIFCGENKGLVVIGTLEKKYDGIGGKNTTSLGEKTK
jgi:hypothetical protein